MKSNQERFTGYMLRTGRGDGTLNGYMFVDLEHALEWLSQSFVTDEEYSISTVSFRKRSCCREPFDFKTVKKRQPPSEFLKVHRAMTAAANGKAK